MTDDIDYSIYYAKWHSASEEYFTSYAVFYEQLLAPILKSVNQSSNILDVGCGSGLLVYALKKSGYHQVRGIDVSAQQIALAKERQLPCDLVTADHLPELANSVAKSLDVVFLLDVLEHIEPGKQLRFLRAIETVLKPGGRLIVSVPNANSTFAMRWRYNDWTHHASFTENSLEFVVRNAGFAEITYFPYEFGTRPTFPFVHRLSFYTWALRKCVRFVRRLEAIGELGREGLKIPLGLNLLGVARKAP